MRVAGIPFEELNVDLRASDAKAQILAHSPSGKVPALLTAGRVIWDSLAILEFLAESHAALWPRAAAARALARCVSAEMHSGFQARGGASPRGFLGAGREGPPAQAGRRGRAPHRGHLAGLPQPARRCRSVPFRPVLGRRCDVRSRGLALSYLLARSRPLRR